MAISPLPAEPRLTSLSHGGGCGCKIAPAMLAELLHTAAAPLPCAALLVGRETGDDAAVYRLNDSQAIVATTDFFMPIVDEPFDYGRISAANALSDIYAMGATPLFALAIVGMPLKLLSPAVIREVLRGGESVCAGAGIAVAGGHSIDSLEPIYGLAVIGVVAPQDLKRNSEGRAGDALVLGKPLGVGVLAAALKNGRLGAAGYAALIESTTRLNLAGAGLARIPGVHAMTDVTGFGLLGHLLGMCRGAGLGAELAMPAVPLLAGVSELAAAGVVSGAAARNWAAYREAVTLTAPLGAVARDLLCDPQTSGGLLVACSEAAVPAVLAEFGRCGSAAAAVIGRMVAGAASIRVDATPAGR